MKLRFLLNPTTGEPHIRDHEIQEWEVQDVLEQFVENVAARDGSRAALGQTRNGRWLRVIYRQDPESNPLFVITPMNLRTTQFGQPAVDSGENDE